MSGKQWHTYEEYLQLWQTHGNTAKKHPDGKNKKKSPLLMRHKGLFIT